MQNGYMIHYEDKIGDKHLVYIISSKLINALVKVKKKESDYKRLIKFEIDAGPLKENIFIPMYQKIE